MSSRAESDAMPMFISVDDHVVEPPELWTDRLPQALRDRGPVRRRQKGRIIYDELNRAPKFKVDSDEGATWCDVWYFEDYAWPLHAAFAAIGPTADLPGMTPLTYDDIAPGCYLQAARLEDMDTNHTEASLCFPTVPRFCGQLFLNSHDPALVDLCVRAYNDWMIDVWCADDGHGRLIPLTILPLADPQRAAAEIRRCAAKGAHAVSFSESPAELGLPSVHTDAWEPLFAACNETDTVINMHIGSSSKPPSPSPGAPVVAMVALTHENSAHALVDWLVCGALERYPGLKIALSEGQVGWMPFLLDRLDSAWRRSRRYEPDLHERLPNPPSHYMSQVFACVFDDSVGLANRDRIGMSQLMFETDYPHADSTFPQSQSAVEKMVLESRLSVNETRQFLRTNAIACYGLARYGLFA